MHPVRLAYLAFSALVAGAWWFDNFGSAAESAALAMAEASIQIPDLKRHILALADDTFEGREAGSRGGRAAAIYLGRELQRHRLAGGAKQGYYQPFGNGYSNILGRLEGSDPQLCHEVIIVSAHYDHVGYGNARNSYGPTGYIHNGADDNASGVAGLLETIEAFATLESPPRRTVLFAMWDGEEKGLLGSKHWVSDPTVPLKDVVCMVNMDMIGRLRNERIDVYGTRTAPGFRQLVSLSNRETNLVLDCNWEMTENSDHYTFFQRGIPVLMLHTGLHGDYHRPSDDVERIAFDGAHRITRLLFQTVYELANQSERPRFRPASRTENISQQKQLEEPLPVLNGRLGVAFDPSRASAEGVRLTRVDLGSPAAVGGLQSGDVIIEFAGMPITDVAMLRRMVWAAENPVSVVVRRGGAAEPLRRKVQLSGLPVRLGITWRTDEGEPTALILTRVVPGTPAADAGLRVNDRLYLIDGQGFHGPQQFRQLMTQAGDSFELLYERHGRIGTTRVTLMPTPSPTSQASL